MQVKIIGLLGCEGRTTAIRIPLLGSTMKLIHEKSGIK